MYSRIQYISGGKDEIAQIQNITEVLEAGCKWIQLRMKNVDDEVFLKTAEIVSLLCSKHDATFIINDKVEIAKRVNSHGVHLGKEDTDLVMAREILGNAKIIGATANTFEEIQKAVKHSCDYIGLGPLRYTGTKDKLSPILGFDGIQTILNSIKENRITSPVFAIGGIKPADINELLQAGVFGVAMSSFITNSNEKIKLIKELNQTINENLKNC